MISFFKMVTNNLVICRHKHLGPKLGHKAHVRRLSLALISRSWSTYFPNTNSTWWEFNFMMKIYAFDEKMITIFRTQDDKEIV